MLRRTDKPRGRNLTERHTINWVRIGGMAVLLLAILLAPLRGFSEDGVSGLWDAVAIINGVEIPFRLEISQSGKNAQGYFFDGDRKIGSTSGRFSDNRLELHYDFLNTALYAVFDNDELQGSYTQQGQPPIVLRAVRFHSSPAPVLQAPPLAGTWEMRRIPEEQAFARGKYGETWNLYIRQSGSDLSAAILRVDGDSGTLTGHWKNGELTLSHFAGERPLLLEGRQNADGTLAITLNRYERYLAVRTSEARAKGIPAPPDPSTYTGLKDSAQPLHFRFPDVSGKMFSDTETRFRNKVIILAIGGTWCANCHDEAPFLVELYNKFHVQGLEIIGLNFEEDSELGRSRPHMLAFIRRYKIPYPMLLAGTPDQVEAKLPQLNNWTAYPTTIFIGRDGLVHSIHAGFSSEATGEEHVRLENEITGLVDRLLKAQTR